MKLTDAQVEAMRSVPLNGAPNRLALAMQIAKVKQIRVARETGIAPPTISNLTRGAYGDMALSTARALAEYFGCTIEDLFPARAARDKEAVTA